LADEPSVDGAPELPIGAIDGRRFDGHDDGGAMSERGAE
jgi:hypothetical protein